MSSENYPKYIVAIILLTVFITMIVFYMVPVQIPFLLKEIAIDSSKLIGLTISCFMLGNAIIASLYAKVKRKFSYNHIFSIGFAIFSIGFITISYVNSYYLILCCLFFSGLGGGLLIPNSILWLLSIVSEKKRGITMVLLTTAMFLGQFTSPILVQPIIDYGGLRITFTIVGFFTLIVSVLYLISPNKKGIQFIK